jgi:hypothetical protein
MKLTSSDISGLSGILNVCALGGIDTVVVDAGYVRGCNASKTFVIISQHNVPKLPQPIGLSRLPALKQRLELFSDPATIIDAKESDRGEISSLEISMGRNKAQFRCSSTALIKAPKVINDLESIKIFVNKDEMKIVLNAIKVMGAKKVQLVIKKDKTVSFSLSDDTNDAFVSEISTKAEHLGDNSDSVIHYYRAEIFAPIIRAGSEGLDTFVFTVGELGSLRLTVNGHTVTIMPSINDDEEDE